MPVIPVGKIETCADCAACCHGLEVDLYEADLVNLEESPLDDAATTSARSGETILRQCGSDERCIALSDDGRCTIYDLRPRVCSDFKMGGVECVQQRRRRGVPFPELPDGEEEDQEEGLQATA